MKYVYLKLAVLTFICLAVTSVNAQSFVSLGLGAGIQAGQPSQFYEYGEFGTSRSSFNANLEAAFFSNPFVGFGGSFLISNRSAFMRGMFGPYINIPFGEKLNIQAKALFGWLNGACCPGIGFLNLNGGSGGADYSVSIPITGYAVGLSIKHRIAETVAIGISVDYTSEFSSPVDGDPNFAGYIPVRYITTAVEVAYVIY
jgi:hypothetical protein